MEHPQPPPPPNDPKGSRVQAPLVDSVSCYCGVDTGNFDLQRESTHVQTPLLPGLPDDISIACLIRVPRYEHRKLRLVCKRWYCLLAGDFFYSLRKSLGLAEEWLHIIKQDSDGMISWIAFDPVYQLWQLLPPVPREYSEAFGFGCAVLSGCHLYLFGGNDYLKGSMRWVFFYSARTNKWHKAPNMLCRRQFFGSCVINNCIYVTGGQCEGIETALRSAEMYDPNKNRWSFISDMTPPMVPYVGGVYKGKWYLNGHGINNPVVSEVYDPEANTWAPVSNEMVGGWRNNCVNLDGHLYALACFDGCRLRGYDESTDLWSISIDSKLHQGGSVDLHAVALVAVNGKLCILRNNLCMNLVDVSCPDKHAESNAYLWENIYAGKGHFRNLISSNLSSVAGQGGLNGHFVHCAVLGA